MIRRLHERTDIHDIQSVDGTYAPVCISEQVAPNEYQIRACTYNQLFTYMKFSIVSGYVVLFVFSTCFRM